MKDMLVVVKLKEGTFEKFMGFMHQMRVWLKEKNL